ncbi:hypothetical protein [Streptomyces xinghaiensis]|uniref:hypothetical protein n=1 Tax=Streptomyces xinghaiensis TaxID=1038928 RepID=UPI002E12C74A|nr:hypothetical protein OG463_11805 [Streptomyces xinghaiensis]
MALRELTAVRQPVHSSIGGERPDPCGTAAKYRNHGDRSRPPALFKGQLNSYRDLNDLWPRVRDEAVMSPGPAVG